MNYYNSHGQVYTFKDFYNLDVIDRKNYTKSEVKTWMKKYNISFDSICIWGH